MLQCHTVTLSRRSAVPASRPGWLAEVHTIWKNHVFAVLVRTVPTEWGEVLHAVRLTWASLWHPAPCAYRRAWGISSQAAR